MSLTPESRVLLTDALRPPAGYRVEIAVGTTYSMNLTALLLAPLSFALFEAGSTQEIERVDPIRLLEAARRYSEHTTVFCQAGGIHVPENYRSILTFVEESVLEVMPFHEDAIFHPKIWALRLVDQAGAQLHRVVILSRNMTLDRSWDTALILDEDVDGVIAAGPAAEFVRGLPSLALRPLTDRRAREIEDLATTLTQVKLAAPAPFTAGVLLPIGMSDERIWPFPSYGKRLLAISPFLSPRAVLALGAISPERTLVSRADSLDMIGSRLLEGWDVKVLQRMAEVVPGDDDLGDVSVEPPDGFHEVHDGLHAKTFIVDLPGRESMVVTGSANLTGQTWGTNVEFDAVLTGPTSACGVQAVLAGSAEVPGLERILESHSVKESEGVSDAAIATSYELENFHRMLAATQPNAHVTPVDGDTVRMTVTLDIPTDPPGVTTVWPASLAADAHAQPLGSPLTWTMARENVTPFIAFETTAGDGGAKATRRCVLKSSLTGEVDDRRQTAVFDILKSKSDVLRYLVFLLGDPSYDAMFAQLAGVDADSRGSSDGPALATTDVALFEPLVRATGRDEDALARVASLVADLREVDGGQELVPDGFEGLWDVVWSVHEERRA